VWDQGLSNGGAVVIDYSVYYDQGIGSYVLLAHNVLTDFYVTGVQLEANKVYSFKVSARNQVGSSPLSNPI
jgi:hypothetical protein